jgi:uncharacterized protein (DUF302 family)
MGEFHHGFEKRLISSTFEQAIEKVTAALKNEGFGVITTIDVKETLKQKLDVDFRRYVILGACNPQLARRALECEPHIGLVLPCNVVVQEEAQGVLISILDPMAMFTLVYNPAVAPVAEEAASRLRRVLDAIV